MVTVVTTTEQTMAKQDLTITVAGNVNSPVAPAIVAISRSASTATTRTVVVTVREDLTMNALRIAREAILSLLDHQDFLGYQLAHAKGSVSTEDMERLEDKYLEPGPHDEAALARRAAFLAGIIPERFDAEVVSIAFRCDLEQAERAINAATERIDEIMPHARTAGLAR